ncbi:MAG: RedB protein [Planctomycetota bacterium]
MKQHAVKSNHDARYSVRQAFLRWGIPAGWLILVGLGFTIMNAYATTPGEVSVAPPMWPVDTNLEEPADTFQAIVFAHPDCPCTQATLANIRHLSTKHLGKIKTQLVFFDTKQRRNEWAVTRLKKMAEDIPGSVVALDEDGHEAERFGVRTSGHVLVYSADHELLFSGGVTASRGHEGRSPGLDAIEALVMDIPPLEAIRESAVYGCPLNCPMPKP